MFRRIFYDGSKIHLWETIEGKNIHEVIDHEIEYYVYDDKSTDGITDIFGKPVRRFKSKSRKEISDLNPVNTCCETDIPEVTKFLQKRYAGKELKPDISIFKIGILDIEIESGGGFPYAAEAKYPVNVITIRNLKSKRTYTFGNKPYTGTSKTVDNFKYFDSEVELLTTFVDFFRHCSFDIITGWNVANFDIKYIVNRLKVLGIDKSISPVDSIYEDREGNISIGGISILDYQMMYKEFLKIPMSSYSLHNICLQEIGEGKTELEGSVSTAYKTDWNGFVEYNINDVELVNKLDNKLKLIHLCITLSYQSLIPFEKAVSTIPLVEGYLLKYLHAHNIVMNNRSESSKKEEYVGGYCYATPGFYRDVLSFDFESLYPHLIMEFNISPETLIMNPATCDELIKSPVEGTYYRKDKVGFLPSVVKNIFRERKMYNTRKKISGLKDKKLSPEQIANQLKLDLNFVNKELSIIENENETTEYYHINQYVRKILANSIYGVQGNPFFHFFNVNNARAITVGGQTLIKHMAATINKTLTAKYDLKKEPVVIIDTDSCYIEMKPVIDKLKIEFKTDKDKIEYYLKFIDADFTPVIVSALNDFSKKYNTEQLMNFKHEKIITKLAVFVKKHYIAQTIYSEGDIYDPPEMKYTGVQTVRSDTPEFCRGKLVSLINMIFNTLDREKAIKKIIHNKSQFEKQPINKIASTKGLNKFNEYVKPSIEYVKYGVDYPHKCPMHIKATIAYNYLIERDKLPLVPAEKGAKIKYVYVQENNVAQTNAIGFIGQWPKEFDKYFKIDYETQFEKTFLPIVDDLFALLNWEEICYEENLLSDILS